MRLFTAVAFDSASKDAIEKYCDFLMEFGIKGNYTIKNNLHLTLKFLGEADVKRLSDIKSAVSKAASQIESFEIHSTGCGYFASRGDKTVFLGMNGKNLTELANSVDGSMSEIGFIRETRKFTPHITLVRRAAAGEETFSKLPPINISFNVNSVTLFESRRDQGKLFYKPVFVSKLK